MKKIVAILLMAAVTLFCTTPAFAADDAINQDSDPKTKTTTVSYEVSPSYTVTIPEAMTINGVPFSLSADNVVLNSNQVLQVAITTANFGEELFTVKCADDVLEYEIKSNASFYWQAPALLMIVDPAETASKKTELMLDLSDPSASARYAGTYTGTVTFTISTPDRPTN